MQPYILDNDLLANDVARLAADHNPAPLLVLDAASVVRYANSAAVSALHTTSDRLIGQRFADLLDEGSQAKGQAMLEAARQGPTTTYELNQVGGDGSVVLIAYRAVPLPADQGQLLFGQPLSSTVAATERLIALNERLNALFTIATSATRSLVLNDLLHESLVVTLNTLDLRAGAVLLAETADAPLLLAAQRGFSPTAIERLAGAGWFARFVAAGASQGETIVYDGDAADLGLAYDDVPSAVSPLWKLAATRLLSDQQPLGWFVVMTDRYRALSSNEVETIGTIGGLLGAPIKNAQLFTALSETTGQLQAVLDGIDSGVLLVDRAGVVRYANTRLGVLLETSVADWPGHQRDAVLPRQLQRVQRPHGLFSDDLWQLGEQQRVLRRFTDHVTDAVGAPLGSIEVYADVTEIEQMNQLKDEFVAAAAHDLKTPVTAIKGYAQIALRLARKQSDAKLTQQLGVINALSDDLAHLMESLLDMSRIQAGRLRLEVTVFDLAESIAKASHHFDFSMTRQQRLVALALPPEPILVSWDRHRIERVLINLLGNAIKYSPEGGPVEIGARLTEEQEVELTVTDHGIGIPADERERVFERFYRVRQSVDDGFKGTGLGLYICRQIVETHGGRIWAEPARHGGPGTTIALALPQCISEDEAEG